MPVPDGRRRAGGRAEDSAPVTGRFLRLVLPLILVLVAAAIALFVINAFEVTAMMESEKRAGPTILNR